MLPMWSKLCIILFSLGFHTCLWAGDALWIDVRTTEEYNAGHVSQAIHIPYDVISSRIGEVAEDKSDLIYVYCRSGRRSGIAKEALEKQGYTNVVNLGGFKEAQEKAAQPSSG